MGHDIYAYRRSAFPKGISESSEEDEISYLRASAFNRHKAHILYDALDAHDCDGGVSGNGGVREFSQEQVKNALAKFLYMKGEPEDEIINEVYSSEPTQRGVEMLGKMIEAISGSVLEDSAFSISHEDMESNSEDVHRFLREIQVDEPVVIAFY